MSTEPTQEQQVNVAWPGAEEMPLTLVNQFVAQVGLSPEGPYAADWILLSMGRLDPPFFVGDPEDARREFEARGSVLRIETVSRFAITRDRAQELLGLLHRAIEQYDATSSMKQGQ